MKLKRIQVVELSNGMKRLMVDGHGPMGMIDMCFERGAMMFGKALHKRMQSGVAYDFRKPMDVAAMVVAAFDYGKQFEQGASLQYSVQHNKQTTSHVFGELSESNDLTDPLLTLKCGYMDRYLRLFTHLYGKDLEAKGVQIDA